MLVIPRGNTREFEIKITESDGETLHILSPTEQLIVTVKRTTEKSEQPIIEKIFTADDYNSNGELWVKFTPSDTINMRDGDYKYDLAVLIDGEDFYTVIGVDTLRILPAVGDMRAFNNG